jgi:hypothetical protein
MQFPQIGAKKLIRKNDKHGKKQGQHSKGLAFCILKHKIL